MVNYYIMENHFAIVGDASFIDKFFFFRFHSTRIYIKKIQGIVCVTIMCQYQLLLL